MIQYPRMTANLSIIKDKLKLSIIFFYTLQQNLNKFFGRHKRWTNRKIRERFIIKDTNVSALSSSIHTTVRTKGCSHIDYAFGYAKNKNREVLK